MNDLLVSLKEVFSQAADPENAQGQKAYMKDQFDFLGLKAPVRRELQKPFLAKAYLPPKGALPEIVHALWEMPWREYQYFGQELVYAYHRQFQKADLELLEFMVVHKSWWDTVDYLASKPIGAYLLLFPEQREGCVETWIRSGNIWLQRTALLFQLGYKEKTDRALLTGVIEALLGTDEFFIDKAIGWILRTYARVDSKWVLDFCDGHDLAPLSRREALKHLQ